MPGAYWSYSPNFESAIILQASVGGGEDGSLGVTLSNLDIEVSSVPKPSTILLLGTGLFGLAVYRRHLPS